LVCLCEWRGTDFEYIHRRFLVSEHHSHEWLMG